VAGSTVTCEDLGFAEFALERWRAVVSCRELKNQAGKVMINQFSIYEFSIFKQ